MKIDHYEKKRIEEEKSLLKAALKEEREYREYCKLKAYVKREFDSMDLNRDFNVNLNFYQKICKQQIFNYYFCPKCDKKYCQYSGRS